MARIGVIFGDETIEIGSKEKGTLYQDSAYVSWDKKGKKIISLGNEAKKKFGKSNNSYETIKLFNNGVFQNEKLFQPVFDQIFLPLKEQLKNQEVVVGLAVDSNSKTQKLLETALNDYELSSLTFIPNIYLLAIGANCDVSDDYGTIVLNFGSERVTTSIISDNQIIASKIYPLAEDFLNNQLLIFFKEQFQIIINQTTIDDVKYNLASLTISKHEVELIVTGLDLVTNLPKEILVTDIDIKKIFTGLFINYRSSIIQLLEESPAYIRTGITKNGLLVSGNMSKIHGIKDYFTSFFEFPTVVSSVSNNNEALIGAYNVVINDFQK